MYFTLITYHTILLAVFIVNVLITWRTIARLRDTALAYKGRLPFAYYSLAAWIFWALQYVILIASTFYPDQDHSFLSAAISIGLVSNVLWGTAILSLYSRWVNRHAFRLTYLIGSSFLVVATILIAIGSYVWNKNEILGSRQFTLVEGVLCAAIFCGLALSINELRQSKVFVIAFLIHGLSQGVWQDLFISLSTMRLTLLLIFPAWNIVLLLFWTKLIPYFLQTAQPDDKEVRLVNLPVALLEPFRVMVSSTVKDLVQERKVAHRTITRMHLDVFLAETYQSLPGTPRSICEQVARQCDIFVLIIGQRYGHVPGPSDKSVVQLEYEAALAESHDKILAYVKEGVTREVQLEEFLKRVNNFNSGHFKAPFTSPDELGEKLKKSIMEWLVSRAKRRPKSSR